MLSFRYQVQIVLFPHHTNMNNTGKNYFRSVFSSSRNKKCQHQKYKHHKKLFNIRSMFQAALSRHDSTNTTGFARPYNYISITDDMLSNGTTNKTSTATTKPNKKKQSFVYGTAESDDDLFEDGDAVFFESSDDEETHDHEPHQSSLSVPRIYFLPESMIGKTVHSDQEAFQLFGSLCCSLCGKYFSPGSPEAISHVEEEFGLCSSSTASPNNNNSLMMTRTNIGSQLDRVSRQKNRSNFLVSDSREEAAVVFLHVAVTKLPGRGIPVDPEEARMNYDVHNQFQWDDPDQFSFFGAKYKDTRDKLYDTSGLSQKEFFLRIISNHPITGASSTSNFRLVIACSNKISLASLEKHISDAWFNNGVLTSSVFIPNTDQKTSNNHNNNENAIYVRNPHINAAHLPVKERDMARCTVGSILGDVGRSAILHTTTDPDSRSNQDRARENQRNKDMNITIDVIRRVDGKSTFLSEPITVMRNTKFVHVASMISSGLERQFFNAPSLPAGGVAAVTSSLFDLAKKHNLANSVLVKSSKKFRDITDTYAEDFKGKDRVLNEVKTVLTNRQNRDKKFRLFLFNPNDELVEETKIDEAKAATRKKKAENPTKNKKAQQTKKKAAKKETPTSTRATKKMSTPKPKKTQQTTKKPAAKTSSPKKKAAAVERKPKAKASSSPANRKAVAIKKKPIAKKASPKKAKKPVAKKTQAKKKK